MSDAIFAFAWRRGCDRYNGCGMSAITAQVPLADYLNTEYEPDCDYVDGVLEERNVGKGRHSKIQTRLVVWLGSRARQHGHGVRVEQRVQVSQSRVRIPDICLVAADETDEVIQRPPALCVEVLSPDDRWSRVQERLTDFLNFSVPMIWIVDPYSNEAWIATKDKAVARVNDDKLRCPDLGLEIELSEIFAD